MITSKILAALVNCVIFLLITWGASLFSVAKYKPDREFYDFLSLSMLALLIMQMIFLTVGVFLGCAMKQYKRAGPLSVSFMLGTYLLSVITDLNENLEFLKYFTPFKFFDPGVLTRQSKIDINFVWLSAVIIAVLIVGAYVSYARRDLYI